MLTRIKQYENKFQQLTEKKKLRHFSVALIMFFLFYYWLFLRPLITQKNNLLQSQQQLTAEITIASKTLAGIEQIIQEDYFKKLLLKEKKLKLSVQRTQEAINHLSLLIFDVTHLKVLTDSILKEESFMPGIIQLKELPTEIWSLDNSSKKDFLQYPIIIDFQSNYFATLTFLKRIEKISSALYWDTFELKVSEYPTALVSIKFHVLGESTDVTKE